MERKMKIKFHNGKVSTARNDVGYLFVDAGLAVEILDVHPVVEEKTIWTVGQDIYTGKIYIRAVRGSSSMKFEGPDSVYPSGKRIFGNETCPPEISAQFKEIAKRAPAAWEAAIAKMEAGRRNSRP
jgi:hypothetical protein